jgi:hypothetical protein
MAAEMRTVVRMDVSIARQWHSKYVSTAMNQHTTIQELLETTFSMQSMPKLYDKAISQVQR